MSFLTPRMLSSPSPTSRSLPLKFRRKSLTASDVDEPYDLPIASSSHDGSDHDRYPYGYSSASSSPIASSAALASVPSSPMEYTRFRSQSSPMYGCEIRVHDVCDDPHEQEGTWANSFYAGYGSSMSPLLFPRKPGWPYSSPSDGSEEPPWTSDFEVDVSEYSDDAPVESFEGDTDLCYSSPQRRISFSTSAERDQPFIRPTPEIKPKSATSPEIDVLDLPQPNHMSTNLTFEDAEHEIREEQSARDSFVLQLSTYPSFPPRASTDALPPSSSPLSGASLPSTPPPSLLDLPSSACSSPAIDSERPIFQTSARARSSIMALLNPSSPPPTPCDDVALSSSVTDAIVSLSASSTADNKDGFIACDVPKDPLVPLEDINLPILQNQVKPPDDMVATIQASEGSSRLQSPSYDISASSPLSSPPSSPFHPGHDLDVDVPSEHRLTVSDVATSDPESNQTTETDSNSSQASCSALHQVSQAQVKGEPKQSRKPCRKARTCEHMAVRARSQSSSHHNTAGNPSVKGTKSKNNAHDWREQSAHSDILATTSAEEQTDCEAAEEAQNAQKARKRRKEGGSGPFNKKRRVILSDVESELEDIPVKGKAKDKEGEKENKAILRKALGGTRLDRLPKVVKARTRNDSDHDQEHDISPTPAKVSPSPSLPSSQAKKPTAVGGEVPQSRLATPNAMSHLPLPLAEVQGMLIETFATSRASSLPASSLYNSIMESRPVLKDAPSARSEGKMSKKEWTRLIEDVLEEGRVTSGVFDKVENRLKIDVNHRLEAQWFYVPERDEDQERATLIRSMMPRPAKRNETKKYKQYYWRPLGKISRWDPEDDL
ncbi:hypothetical protein AcW1_008802 [Taiwanofungus camphoratus]|nr:hypothetical protein AcV7_003713 [Antrodia cinnamomea]KAI0949101.1 hypothetical protein AcW1_008802 [Antrodia cinnamomea]